ncbi:MAG: hypothetical protein II449_05295 [Prevotella sp.]|nr:hypothetical protein [Prevotella sp.]
MPKKGTTKITQEQIDKIFEQLEDGVSLRKACEKQGIRDNTFLYLVDKSPTLAEQYARAKIKGQDARFEGMLDYAQNSKDDPATKRLYIDTLKWVLAKQQPKKYGDKLEVEGKNIAPTIITIKRADD